MDRLRRLRNRFHGAFVRGPVLSEPRKLLYFAVISSCFWFILGMIFLPMAREIQADIIDFWNSIVWRIL
jgi:hypothetical protein